MEGISEAVEWEYEVTASSGQNPVTGVTYNLYGTPPQVTATYGSGDSDVYSLDANTGRTTKYQFNVGSSSDTGALTWNANGSLSQLAITDGINSGGTQTCNYTHDDLSRIATANCGAAANQSFAYDAFGNISKSGSPYTFQPSYNSNNQMTSVGGFTPTYDANGNTLTDPSHTYSWNADGSATNIDSVSLTYDAFGRMVEQNRSGAYTQIVYAPTGDKLALMHGQTLQKAIVPLPGGGQAVYNASGILYYGHSDHLGSIRLGSTTSRGSYFDTAYAPFGETYATFGGSNTDPDFTGQRQDTVSGLYDFPAREYSNEGRWHSPDPAGLAAVDPTNPQSWNRYAYVLNNPMALSDPSGLDPCQGANAYQFSQAGDATGIFTPEDCAANGGTWGDSWLGGGGSNGGGGLGALGFGNPTPGCELVYSEDDYLNYYFVTMKCDPQNSSGGSGPKAPKGSGSSSGFTLGIRAPGQTFNQCLVQNAANYSAGGVFDLAAGTTIGNSTAGQVLAGNTFTGAYSALAGSVEDAATVAGTAAPDLLNSAIGTTTTFGRRTSNILALNLAGKGGLPQALSSSSGGLKSLLGSASKALNLGLEASLKAAIDAGLAGAEVIGCSIHR